MTVAWDQRVSSTDRMIDGGRSTVLQTSRTLVHREPEVACIGAESSDGSGRVLGEISTKDTQGTMLKDEGET